MKKQRMFRPSLTDVLEERLVLSTASAHVAAAIPAFQAADLAAIGVQINNAFAAFQLDYSQAQAAYLSAAAASPTATNTTLQNFVSTRVDTLIQQINGYVAGLPGATPALVGFVTAPLGGNKLGTLVQQLQSIAPVGTNGQTPAQYADQAAKIIQNASQTTESSFKILGNQVNFDLFSKFQSQLSGANGHKRLTALQRFRQNQQNKVNAAINQAFTTYFNSLVTARMNTLFANPGTGTLDLSGNVAKFNSQLATATIALSNSLTTALAGQRGALKSLQPSIVQSLFGANTGLFSQLTSSQAPTDINGLSAQAFNNNLFGMLNTTFQDVSGRINAFNQTPSTNFSTFNQFGNNSFVPSLGSNGFFTGLSNTGTGSGTGTGNVFGSGFGTVPGTGSGNSLGNTSAFSSGFGLSGFNSFFGGTNLTSGTSTNGTGLGTGATGTGTTGTGTTGTGTTGTGTTGTGTTTNGGFTFGNGFRTFGSGNLGTGTLGTGTKGSSTNGTGL